jgi:hypothetical protein
MKLMTDLKKTFWLLVRNFALVLIWSPAFKDIYVWLGHCFKAVTLPYLLLIRTILHKFALRFWQRYVMMMMNPEGLRTVIPNFSVQMTSRVCLQRVIWIRYIGVTATRLWYLTFDVRKASLHLSILCLFNNFRMDHRDL